jgi:hypothetical protein
MAHVPLVPGAIPSTGGRGGAAGGRDRAGAAAGRPLGVHQAWQLVLHAGRLAWHPGPVRLAEPVQRGGCAVSASAAACTIGTRTLPVYEVYKAGQAPRWLEGLKLVGTAGLLVAVVPH